MGNIATWCKLGLFHDADVAGDLKGSKSTSGGMLCFFRSHTLVPVSWTCKKQRAASHSCTEAEIVSNGAGPRFEGILALTT